MLNEMDLRTNLLLKKVFIFFYSSVGIVCMVNPDADNISLVQSGDSIAIQRNTPVSCHKHTVQKSRTVGIYSLIILT
jgi:hypothetical protein